MGYQWNFNVIFQAMPEILEGLLLTILIAVVCMVIAMPLGTLLSLARLSKRKNFFSLITKWFIEFFRCTPILMQVYWFYYSLPLILGIAMSPIVTGIVALTLNVSAFVAENVRSGIQSIEDGQRQAALAIGMNNIQCIKRIILPQAIRRIIPALGTQWVTLFKATSLLSVITVAELMYKADVLAITSYRPVEIYTIIAIIYFVVVFPQARFVDRLYDKNRIRL